MANPSWGNPKPPWCRRRPRPVRHSRQKSRATISSARPTHLSSARGHVRVPAELPQAVSDRVALQGQGMGCGPHIRGTIRSIGAPQDTRALVGKCPAPRKALQIGPFRTCPQPISKVIHGRCGQVCRQATDAGACKKSAVWPGEMGRPKRCQRIPTNRDDVPFFPFGIKGGTVGLVSHDCPERE